MKETLLTMPLEKIERTILWIREHKVMLDMDLARLYQVRTFRLNEAVRRNLARFPEDFMFQLTENEKKGGYRKLRSPQKPQVLTSVSLRLHRTRHSYAVIGIKK
jgi:hypothetical protein